MALFDVISNFLNSSKQSKELGTSWKQGVPVEVIPSAYKPVQLKLESMLGGQANLRMAVKKCVCYAFFVLSSYRTILTKMGPSWP